MPTYQYHCTACGDDFEAIQRFTDPAIETCPQCDGRVRKVYNAVGVVFKGSGFYATDSRKSTTASKPAAPAAESASSTASAKVENSSTSPS